MRVHPMAEGGWGSPRLPSRSRDRASPPEATPMLVFVEKNWGSLWIKTQSHSSSRLWSFNKEVKISPHFLCALLAMIPRQTKDRRNGRCFIHRLLVSVSGSAGFNMYLRVWPVKCGSLGVYEFYIMEKIGGGDLLLGLIIVKTGIMPQHNL